MWSVSTSCKGSYERDARRASIAAAVSVAAQASQRRRAAQWQWQRRTGKGALGRAALLAASLVGELIDAAS